MSTHINREISGFSSGDFSGNFKNITAYFYLFISVHKLLLLFNPKSYNTRPDSQLNRWFILSFLIIDILIPALKTFFCFLVPDASGATFLAFLVVLVFLVIRRFLLIDLLGLRRKPRRGLHRTQRYQSGQNSPKHGSGPRAY